MSWLSILVFNTRFSVIGSRGETASAPPSAHMGPRQPVDQADLAAVRLRDIGPVHPVDDARQHEARLGGIEHGAIEQLEIKTVADADRLIRQACFVFCNVAFELAVDRTPNRRHRRQGEQLDVGERNIRGTLGRQHPADAERPPSSSRKAAGSMTAAPRSSAATGAARTGKAAANSITMRRRKRTRKPYPDECRQVVTPCASQPVAIRKLTEERPCCLAAIGTLLTRE